jgi:hypothetical protein
LNEPGPRGLKLRLRDFAALDAAGADADFARSATDFSFDRTQIDIPAAAADVVRVRDVVAELRSLAADFTDLCHDEKLQNLNCSCVPEPAQSMP